MTTITKSLMWQWCDEVVKSQQLFFSTLSSFEDEILHRRGDWHFSFARRKKSAPSNTQANMKLLVKMKLKSERWAETNHWFEENCQKINFSNEIFRFVCCCVYLFAIFLTLFSHDIFKFSQSHFRSAQWQQKTTTQKKKDYCRKCTFFSCLFRRIDEWNRQFRMTSDWKFCCKCLR